ncbi:MAG: radical SAM family heme chaperone HemW [Acidobacteriota bacterium]
MRESRPLGVYVSVPFCRAKCSFCNFASGVGTAGELDAYVGRLCAEIEGVGAAAEALGGVLPRRVDTVYFGGGTPSLLSAGQLGKIFGALRGVFDVEGDAEITMEAAPLQIGDAVLDEAMRLGVNRLSLGVQSFVDREAAAVGRTHTERECVREIARLQAAGIADVGADLIAGLPYQTEESWRHSLEVAAGAGLAHLSVYMLEVDEDSRLGTEVMAGGQRFHAHAVPEEERSAEMYERACEFLPGMGFGQYEISNFAREGRRSRHNSRYWLREPYVGLGLDAHSMLQGAGSREKGVEGAVRWANAEEMREYGVVGPVVTRVGERGAFEEALFLGLRMLEGVAVDGLREDWVAGCEGAVADMVADGLMRVEDGRWMLTLRGRLVSNEVFGRLLEEVAA